MFSPPLRLDTGRREDFFFSLFMIVFRTSCFIMLMAYRIRRVLLEIVWRCNSTWAHKWRCSQWVSLLFRQSLTPVWLSELVLVRTDMTRHMFISTIWKKITNYPNLTEVTFSLFLLVVVCVTEKSHYKRFSFIKEWLHVRLGVETRF